MMGTPTSYHARRRLQLAIMIVKHSLLILTECHLGRLTRPGPAASTSGKTIEIPDERHYFGQRTHFLQKGWSCRVNADGLPEWILPRWIDPQQRPQVTLESDASTPNAQLSRRRQPAPAA
jgi:hypothetical protein